MTQREPTLKGASKAPFNVGSPNYIFYEPHMESFQLNMTDWLTPNPQKPFITIKWLTNPRNILSIRLKNGAKCYTVERF